MNQEFSIREFKDFEPGEIFAIVRHIYLTSEFMSDDFDRKFPFEKNLNFNSMFKTAIVRKPGKSVVDGISTAGLGRVDYEKLCRQHNAYLAALKKCGIELIILNAEDNSPDSVFIEDVALLTPKCAIVTRPGAISRREETNGMRTVLGPHFEIIEQIKPGGTLEAGDVMMAGNHFYIGLSERTNDAGADQLITILNKYGFGGTKVVLEDMLHLKTGISFIENNTIVVAGQMKTSKVFSSFKKIIVDDDEIYAANCLWINGTVLLAAGYPKTKQAVEKEGYPVIELEMSEFQKLDGGLSCLSLRF
jgi:dimethylargininase